MPHPLASQCTLVITQDAAVCLKVHINTTYHFTAYNVPSRPWELGDRFRPLVTSNLIIGTPRSLAPLIQVTYITNCWVLQLGTETLTWLLLRITDTPCDLYPKGISTGPCVTPPVEFGVRTIGTHPLSRPTSMKMHSSIKFWVLIPIWVRMLMPTGNSDWTAV